MLNYLWMLKLSKSLHFGIWSKPVKIILYSRVKHDVLYLKLKFYKNVLHKIFLKIWNNWRKHQIQHFFSTCDWFYDSQDFSWYFPLIFIKYNCYAYHFVLLIYMSWKSNKKKKCFKGLSIRKNLGKCHKTSLLSLVFPCVHIN